MAQAGIRVLACSFSARCEEVMVGEQGLGGAFLKTLSICFRGAWSDIWSLRESGSRETGIGGRKL